MIKNNTGWFGEGEMRSLKTNFFLKIKNNKKSKDVHQLAFT